MEKTITLPKSGATVTFRDPDTILQKDREKMWSFIDTDSTNNIVRSNSALKGLMAVMVKSWTLDLIIPSVVPDSLGELNSADYDAIAMAVSPWVGIMTPDFTSEETDSPKDNSQDSNGN